MVEEELAACVELGRRHRDPKEESDMIRRFPTSKWYAIRDSSPFREIAPAITAAVFAAQASIADFNKLVDEIEAAQFASWTLPDPGRSGAEILRKNLLGQVRILSEIATNASSAALTQIHASPRAED